MDVPPGHEAGQSLRSYISFMQTLDAVYEEWWIMWMVRENQGTLGYQHNLILLRMKGDPIENFKIMEFLIMVGIFSTFLKLEIYNQARFQNLSLQTNWIFCWQSNIFLK